MCERPASRAVAVAMMRPAASWREQLLRHAGCVQLWRLLCCGCDVHAAHQLLDQTALLMVMAAARL